ncbi:hypothetical protein HZI73_17340 [Vallitalea pronyensis]|uniref:CBM21 domain-containing protein n=1 Tax=Vallitalea pronyensis TaxID=1348613 RepID=A0A8J8MMG0_9FIRM|nr:carbohydrate-binding protein [Vallitalea pronyensis]QUI23948.1 hypothetical protein HZI73_17340 [Vallitalea pronyensis]
MKKKLKRNAIAVIMCLTFMLTFNGLHIQADTTHVQLFSSKLMTTYTNQGQITGYYTTGYIYINNLDYNKNVIVHYTYDGMNWMDQTATYMKTLADGSEVWSYSTPHQAYSPAHQYTYNCQFAIKYEVNGHTYWDNNGGNDYFLQNSSTSSNATNILSKSVVKLNRAGRSSNSIYGSIILKDLGYDKVVKVRYTTDGWQTFHETDAYYQPSSETGVEVWEFNTIKNSYIPWSSGGQYVIRYIVNGVTYWDNNFGDNYSFSPTQDPNIP